MRKIPLNKQQIEEVVFDIFRDKYGLIGEFVHGDKPDFIISHDGHTLGVEITEIYSDEKIYGKHQQEHEVAKDRIVHHACERAKKLGLPPLDVHVIFSDNIPKSKESCLIESLFETVKNNIPQLDNQIVLNNYNVLPEGFGSICIYNRPNLNKPFWYCDEAGAVETRFSKQLQCKINDKAEKIPDYLKKCNKCWLIIAARGSRPSSFYEFGEDMATSRYASPFEKVFFMEVFSETLKELKIMKGANHPQNA